MKLDSKAKKLAKQIFHASFSGEKLDETKMLKLVRILKKTPNSFSRSVLHSLLRKVESYQSQQELIVETAFPLDSQVESALKKTFETSLNKELSVRVVENKALIGGIRIKNGDNVWENTIESNLENLKGNFVSNF